jgi:glucose-6-phosphate-specific signal transduction histidine kinase
MDFHRLKLAGLSLVAAGLLGCLLMVLDHRGRAFPAVASLSGGLTLLAVYLMM